VISGKTLLIAHLGYPTEAFKAPMIYNPWFRKHGIDAVVVPMGVKAEDYPAALAALAVTFIAVVAWRLHGGADGYVRDVTAGVFVLIYLPTMATFVAMMVAQPHGAHRALLFAILTVCSDSGGYFAGILFGRHPMAPTISPKKTWEGLAGSAVLCLAAGAVGMRFLLPGTVWEGLLLGVAAVAAATLGDLVESMIKRDLDTKDMGSILPGHGGVLDRIDAMLIVAPVSWLLMTIFLS